MTQEKIYMPSTAENYNIEDLESGDETDDEVRVGYSKHFILF